MSYKDIKLNNIENIKDVNVDDKWLNHYLKIVDDVMIPMQLKLINGENKNNDYGDELKNLRLAADVLKGKNVDEKFEGFIFQDSDIAKWIQSASYSLMREADDELEATIDELIDLIAKAQWEDGYINTYFTIEHPDKRWKNIFDCHELYVAGHLIEAAVAYYVATSKDKFLNIMIKFADLICATFGKSEDKIRGYPGHQEIELALVKLFLITADYKYLEQAEYFIKERGSNYNFFARERNSDDFFEYYPNTKNVKPILDYAQAHKPVMDQEHATGHSVRAIYMYSAMVDVALITNNDELLNKSIELWEDIVNSQMYLTGSVGQSGFYERFTVPYDLPNDANYSETCASIALAMFSQRLLNATLNSRFADIVELEIFNGVASGVNLEGDKYFYANPMSVWAKTCLPNTSRDHVKASRQTWFGCACCPPNLSRFYSSIQRFIYTEIKDDDTNKLYINQYISNSYDNNIFSINLNSSYILNGKVVIDLQNKENLDLYLRKPKWCEELNISINKEEYTNKELEKGYVKITLLPGDYTLELDFNNSIQYISSNSQVRSNQNKVAVSYGPLIYALETANTKENISLFRLDINTRGEYFVDENQIPKIKVHGVNEIVKSNENLYQHIQDGTFKYLPTEKIMIPYAFWGNGKEDETSEMNVWLQKI